MQKKITEILSDEENIPKNFEINGEKYNIEKEGRGAVGTVYKITDKNGNKAALKHYYNEWSAANNGRVEILISEQMTKDGVFDIPKFYMASVADYKIGDDKKIYKHPQWILAEFIEEGQKVVEGMGKYQALDKGYIKGQDYIEWEADHKLCNSDESKENNHIGEYLVDLGGFYHKRNCPDDAPDINSYSYSALKNGILRGMGVEGAIRHYECWKKYYESIGECKN